MATTTTNIEFNLTLRRKVKDYFNEKQLSRRGGFSMMLKTSFILFMLLGSYMGLMLLGPISLMLLPPFFLLTLFFQLVSSFAVMHDASHNALSRKKWYNIFIVHLLLGAGGVSAQIWKQKHVVGHHMHTNVSKQDTDIEGEPLFMFSPHQKKRKFHRFQYLYAVFFYSMLAIKWIAYDDMRDLIMNVYHLNKKQWLICCCDIVLTRICYITLSIIIPTLLFGSLLHVILFWLVYNALLGLGLTMVFQCAHVNTKTLFYNGTEDNRPSFSEQQLLSTVDYAVNNRILTWMVGGLNFQVIHHLFPTVSHRHYPAIHKILLQVVSEYPSIKYHQFPTFLAAIKDHFVFLKEVARN